MISRFNHVAIAVPDLNLAKRSYEEKLGAKVSEIKDYPNHGVSVVFVDLGNAKIELLYPLGDNSPISNFLKKNPEGGIHHICLEVDNIDNTCKQLESQGVRILGSGEPKIGAHDKPVIFLHPKDFFGTLIEIEQS